MPALELDGRRFGRYVALAPPRFLLTGRPLPHALNKLNNIGGLVATVMTRSREIAAALAGEGIGVMVGCSGNPFDLPAAYLAARRLRVPFVAYLFDDPVYQWEPGVYRSLARFWERIWGLGSASMIAPNEVLADDLRLRLPHADIAIVRNPVGSAAFAPPASDGGWGEETGDAGTLLYTGSVYSAQASAFRNLLAALAELDGRFHLNVYTAQSADQMVAHGVCGPEVRHLPHTSQDVALELQKRADILFLPLAFVSPIPEVVRSSAPAKLGEYLASGRPILAHAPRGSFVSELLKTHQAALVVDQPDPALLKEALLALATDEALGKRLVVSAQRLAREFHVDRARDAFLAAISRATD